MLDRRQEIPQDPRATPVVLRALVNGVDDAQLRRRPAPEEWAIIEEVTFDLKPRPRLQNVVP